MPRLIRLCRIQWCCSLFLFLTSNTFFRQILSQKLVSLEYAEFSGGVHFFWYVDQFEFAEFNGGVHLDGEILFFRKFGQKKIKIVYKQKRIVYAPIKTLQIQLLPSSEAKQFSLRSISHIKYGKHP